jgi:hypothetical protein
MTTPFLDSKYPYSKPAWPILFLIIVAGGLISTLTEHLIGDRIPPTCKIGDFLQHWTSGLNDFVSSREWIGDALIIFYSILGDAIVLILIVCAIVKSSIRPVLPLLVFLLLRQAMQLIVSFPVDPGLIWHYPGFPSLFSNYRMSGDFYFSAYVGILILGALELGEIFKVRWLTALNFFVAFLVAFIDLVLRSHYTTDIYTSIVTAIFAYLFTEQFVPPVDQFLKKLDRLSHFLLIFLICAGIACIFTTQYFIGKKSIPACGITDAIQNFFLPFNQFVHGHVHLGDAILICMNFLLDCMFLFMFVDTIITRNIRPFLTYALFFALRQSMQFLVALPIPPDIIWHYPGFPSLLQNYHISNDLYFSGHAGISLIAALEMSSFGKRWLTALGFTIFACESLLVIGMQIHYSMDVFTAIVTVFCITDLSCHLAHPINRFLSKLMKPTY